MPELTEVTPSVGQPVHAEELGPTFQQLDTPEVEPVGVTPEPAASTDDRVRDPKGRFAPSPTSEFGTPEEPTEATPKFAPALIQAASQFLTEEEISSIPSAELLIEVMHGRANALRSQSARTTDQGGNGQVVPESIPSPEPEKLDDFVLNLPEDDLSPEVTQQLKGLVEHFNMLKGSMNELHAQNAELKQGVRQSAEASKHVAQQQHAGFWDNLAAQVPGMVEAIGKPSTALTNDVTPQAKQWRDLAPLIAARVQAQGVPGDYTDFPKAINEAWAMYRSLNGNETTNSTGRPGVAVRGSQRLSSAPAPRPKEDMGVREEYEYRLSRMEALWHANNGRNPF